MATLTFKAPPRPSPQLDTQPLIVPKPKPLENSKQAHWAQKIIPFVMIFVVVGMIALMAMSGIRDITRNPMFLMAPLGMLMMGVMYMGFGGAGGGALTDLNQLRKDYFLELDEKRKLAHLHGEQIHALQSAAYPHPRTLLSRIGRNEMWSFKATSPIGSAETDDAQEIPAALHPWLTARVGVGIARVLPQPEIPEDMPVGQQLEPVTALFYRRFLRTQRFVTNCPLGISFVEQSGYSLRGNPDSVLGLARAIMCSLAYNHSPRKLAIGLITTDTDSWDWFKWLPNSQNRHKKERSGTARLTWSSIAEFLADTSLQQISGHLIVFIDTPNSDVALPAQLPLTDVTFVALRCQAENISTDTSRYQVNAERQFSTPLHDNYAHADSLTIQRARLIAQKMTRWRPEGWDLVDSATASDQVEETEHATFFEGIGIHELESFDPRPTWRKNEWDSHFYFPLGFAGPPGAVTNDVAILDFGEASVGGAGPHGCIQGVTGAGKSMLLTGMVLGASALYSPTKVNWILADFKGGATFVGCEKLPHTVANITNLDGQSELIERLVDVIEGEILRREERNAAYNVDGIVEYRERRAKEPDKYPPYPELFIIIDEFREYMATHKEHLKLLSRVGTVGRALGIHLIACSQYIDMGMIGDITEHLTFGISLKTSSGSRSRAIVKTDAAKDLPLGKGAAILYQEVGERTSNLVGFNVKAPYIPPSGTPVAPTEAPASTLRAENRLYRFTLANQFAEDTADTGEATANATPEAGDHDQADEEESSYVGGHLRMRDALVDHLATFTNEGKALDLWKPSLRAPISYADINIEPATSQRLRIRIGDTDAPRESKRLPYELCPDSGREHVRIVGRSHSGRSTAVQAIICGAARSYSPQFCSFYVIDYGGSKLAEIAGMPNVGGYTGKGDRDAVTRYVCEAFRLVDIREREFNDRGVGSLDQYFASRATSPVADDPYGHFFLVIDGFGSYVEDFEDTKSTFKSLLTNGARLGVHVIVTVESMMRMPMQLHEFFGSVVQLAVEDPTAAVGSVPEVRALMKMIPSDQPGRCVDVERRLAARIVVPQFEEIKPVRIHKGMPEYDNNADYTAGVADFVTHMQQTSRNAAGEPIRAPKLEAAPKIIDHGRIAEVYNQTLYQRAVAANQGRALTADEFGTWWSAVPATQKRLPLGVSTQDLRIVELPDEFSPHLLVAGASKSGRTSVLRGLINS
ncbi:FtsK/SpoIIIE domain-containing protein, partial [Mycolicibacterium fortuitum]|uniref:FtsK/SpoIIIE domain-containing protein n=1 Tax=Mycolicibacterium fortuitum TaxID=1766 RepID=UPI002615007B